MIATRIPSGYGSFPFEVNWFSSLNIVEFIITFEFSSTNTIERYRAISILISGKLIMQLGNVLKYIKNCDIHQEFWCTMRWNMYNEMYNENSHRLVKDSPCTLSFLKFWSYLFIFFFYLLLFASFAQVLYLDFIHFLCSN